MSHTVNGRSSGARHAIFASRPGRGNTLLTPLGGYIDLNPGDPHEVHTMRSEDIGFKFIKAPGGRRDKGCIHHVSGP